MTKKTASLLLIIGTLLACSKPTQKTNNNVTKPEITNWKSEVETILNLFGHRNWIVIADGAYPQQSNQAIKTISIDADQIETVEFISQQIEKAKHVNAKIYIDKEMAFVPEEDAKGIKTYRNKLNEVLLGKSIKTMLHEDIIQKIDTSAKLYNVLILKTNLTIPYTSVFFELECGYWNAEAEEKLRSEFIKQ